MPRFTKYLVSILLLFLAPIVVAQESCCSVTAGMIPVLMPPGQTAYDDSNFIVNAFLSPMTGAGLAECPRPVNIMSYQGMKNLNRMIDGISKAMGCQPDPKEKQLRAEMHGLDVDYLFIGTLTAANTVIIDGYLYGQFTLYVQLIDNCPDRRGTVLKEGQTSWDGSNTQIAGEGGIICRASLPAIEELGRSFMPLDNIIYDYERTPEHCDIQPEKEPVKIGEKITINLQNIVDGQGRTSQPWQQLLVKVEKGKILNGIENVDCRRFPVGEAGTVAVEYQAPDECPQEKTDTITVENSCNCCDAAIVNFPPDREIAHKEIKINCGAELEFTYHQICNDFVFFEDRWDTGRIPFSIEGNIIEMDEPAELQITASGYFIDIDGGKDSFSWSGSEMATIKGELVPQENGEPELHFTLSITVSEETQPFIGGTLTLDSQFVFPYKDGYTDEVPFAWGPCTGTNVYILHIK